MSINTRVDVSVPTNPLCADLPRARIGETFDILVERHHSELTEFIVGEMNQHHDTPQSGQHFLDARQALVAHKGTLAGARWEFGIALNLARSLASTRACGVAMLRRGASAGLPYELLTTLLLVTDGSLSLDMAGILLVLPVAVVRSRLAHVSRVPSTPCACGHANHPAATPAVAPAVA
ncbi:hypothetical protein [Rugamonas aquatica]|uniref:Uncharacterized protein n=1 Tax=Rugamonas aquatica TaxID=2743357 RepID=A0A6A7N7Q5_9BURK|nr:hypothetical protein [Rugamonas aquatica]MQA40777.1 hypothetical protein [Rugamonas aquatica]